MSSLSIVLEPQITVFLDKEIIIFTFLILAIF